MKNIYIDKNEKYIRIANNKNKTINEYGNIHTNGKNDILSSIKLVIFTLNKIFSTDKRYFDEEYIFHINDKELINLIKNENDFYTKIDKSYHEFFDKVTVSEIGRLLSLLKKIPYKNMIIWENNTDYRLQLKRESLYQRQSICDTATQDILHSIGSMDIENLSGQEALIILKRIKGIRIERDSIKDEIKQINNQLNN